MRAWRQADSQWFANTTSIRHLHFLAISAAAETHQHAFTREQIGASANCLEQRHGLASRGPGERRIEPEQTLAVRCLNTLPAKWRSVLDEDVVLDKGELIVVPAADPTDNDRVDTNPCILLVASVTEDIDLVVQP